MLLLLKELSLFHLLLLQVHFLYALWWGLLTLQLCSSIHRHRIILSCHIHGSSSCVSWHGDLQSLLDLDHTTVVGMLASIGWLLGLLKLILIRRRVGVVVVLYRWVGHWRHLVWTTRILSRFLRIERGELSSTRLLNQILTGARFADIVGLLGLQLGLTGEHATTATVLLFWPLGKQLGQLIFYH